jgi:hypothetical protein
MIASLYPRIVSTSKQSLRTQQTRSTDLVRWRSRGGELLSPADSCRGHAGSEILSDWDAHLTAYSPAFCSYGPGETRCQTP